MSFPRVKKVELDIKFPTILKDCYCIEYERPYFKYNLCQPKIEAFLKVIILDCDGVEREYKQPLFVWNRRSSPYGGIVNTILSVGDKLICKLTSTCLPIEYRFHIAHPIKDVCYEIWGKDTCNKYVEEVEKEAKNYTGHELKIFGVELGFKEAGIHASCAGHKCVIIPTSLPNYFIGLFPACEGNYVEIPYDDYLPKDIEFEMKSIFDFDAWKITEVYIKCPVSYDKPRTGIVHIRFSKVKPCGCVVDFWSDIFEGFTEISPCKSPYEKDDVIVIEDLIEKEVSTLNGFYPEPEVKCRIRLSPTPEKSFEFEKTVKVYFVVPSDYTANKISISVSSVKPVSIKIRKLLGRLRHRVKIVDDVGNELVIELYCKEKLDYSYDYVWCDIFQSVPGEEGVVHSNIHYDVSGTWPNPREKIKLIIDVFDEFDKTWQRLFEKEYRVSPPCKPEVIDLELKEVKPREIWVCDTLRGEVLVKLDRVCSFEGYYTLHVSLWNPVKKYWRLIDYKYQEPIKTSEDKFEASFSGHVKKEHVKDIEKEVWTKIKCEVILYDKERKEISRFEKEFENVVKIKPRLLPPKVYIMLEKSKIIKGEIVKTKVTIRK